MSYALHYRLVLPRTAPRQFAQFVRPIVSEAVSSAQKVLPLESLVQLNVIPDKSEALAELQGSTGWTHDSRHADIWVDMGTRGWRGALRRTVVHELNHTIRARRTGKRTGQYTMLDTIAFEGLAQCFENQVCGELPPYATSTSYRQVRRVWGLIKDDLDSLDESLYRRIFFAKGDGEVPKWAGYGLSYWIVSRRMKQLRVGWSLIMGLPSEEIVGPGLG